MRRHLSLLLLILNAVLLACLVWMWLRPDGSLKNAHWQMPSPQKSNIEELIPAIGKPQVMEQAQFLAMLDRPLFAPTRRPPPPPKPEGKSEEAPPPPPDYLEKAMLTGVYFSEDRKTGGIIIRYKDKDKSLPLQGMLDGWKLSSVADNRVYFSRGFETREIVLQKAKLQSGGVAATGANVAGSVAKTFEPSPSGAPSGSSSDSSVGQASIGGGRPRVNRRNSN